MKDANPIVQPGNSNYYHQSIRFIISYFLDIKTYIYIATKQLFDEDYFLNRKQFFHTFGNTE